MALVYALGVVVAVKSGATVDVGHVSLAFVAFLPVALTIHFANEYADYETDLLADRTPFSGGSGALARSGLSRHLARRATVWSAVVSVAVVAMAFASGVLSVTAVGLLALVGLLGVEYSLPPLSLAWRGVGEVDNAVLGGLLLPGYGLLVASGSLGVTDLVAFVPFTVLVFANLLATTWPDREPDASVGKRTLATRLDPLVLRRLYLVSLVVAYGSLTLLTGSVVPPLVAGASLVAVPFSLWGARQYTVRHSPFPSVAAMVVFAAAQFLAWGVLALEIA
jgi:1,4-dihydroxy-2-naphthoate octaprenyltransferase